MNLWEWHSWTLCIAGVCWNTCMFAHDWVHAMTPSCFQAHLWFKPSTSELCAFLHELSFPSHSLHLQKIATMILPFLSLSFNDSLSVMFKTFIDKEQTVPT
jgi:hypothetical protein